MNKDKWIGEVLDSTKGMKPAALSHDFSMKLRQLKSPSQRLIPARWVLALAAMITVLLALNIVVWADSGNIQRKSGLRQLMQEYNLKTTGIYSITFQIKVP